ncbi:MAG: caspase family protein [Rhodocyclaceae bacterium]|nr:caspase family protein [Rhodocyclaceae bacterium]
MQPVLIRYAALALFGLFATGSFAAEPQRNLGMASTGAEKRVALVIGNAAYPGAGALKNPANDAKDIAAKLRRLGFDVIVQTNVRQKEMLRSLTEFGDKVQSGAEALFFYAGHGMQVRGRNYLIPIDAEIRSESSVSSEAVDVDQLLDKLAPARLSMVILDACRNNPFERRFRGGGQGLAQINAPAGTLIAYATAPGKVAADGDGRNGLYTAELLAAMDVPGIKIEDVFKRVRANVVRKSNEAQIPWESSSLTGDFYFRGGASGAAPTTAQPAAPISAATLELAFWESADRGNTAADYTAYLNKYADGQFAELARNRLEHLSGGVQVASIAPGTLHDRTLPVTAPALPKVGDFWRYRGSNQNGADAPTYKVTDVLDGRIEIRYVSNINEQMTLVLNTDWNPLVQLGQQHAEEIKFVPFAPYFQFPLEPGKKWRGQYKGECGIICSFEVDYEYEVRGWETITVPAGKFEALRIDSRDNYRHAFGIASTGTRSAWFVPAIRQPVKFEYRYNGKRLHEYELESYQVAK